MDLTENKHLSQLLYTLIITFILLQQSSLNILSNLHKKDEATN
ncbi:hypothetical protein [Atopobacter phocae]|nr:hypothetical protein [Atopobacter phocae]